MALILHALYRLPLRSNLLFAIYGRVTVPEKGLRRMTMDEAVGAAKENLDTLWFVGVTEQYGGFMEVLKAIMDPHQR